MDLSAVTAYAHFVFEDTSSVGCGLELPCIAYSKNRPRIGDIHPLGPPRFDRHVRRERVRSLHIEYTSSDGCALGLPRIAYSQNGTSDRRCPPQGPPNYLRWTCPQWPHMFASSLSTLAESDAPSYCLALRISENAPMLSNRDDFRHLLRRTGSESRCEVSLVKRDTI